MESHDEAHVPGHGDGEGCASAGIARISEPPSSSRPGLFVKTVLPASAVSHALPCQLVPPDAVLRRFGWGAASLVTSASAPAFSASRPHTGQAGPSPATRNVAAGGDSESSLQEHSQLIVSTETALHLYAVDVSTLALVQFASMPAFTRVLGLARVSRMDEAKTHVLAVLSEHSRVSFVEYNIDSDTLVCTGSVYVIGPPVELGDSSELRHAQFIAAHPSRHIVAVATFESSISVFPVQLSSNKVSTGKVLTESIDGVVLSLDFIEDDGRDDSPSVLIALVQKGPRQYLSVLAVGLRLDTGGGGISLAVIASVGTCASRQGDAAVARAQFRLTGEPIRPPRNATAVSRLPGCPYVCVVFLDGRVVAADVRALVEDSEFARARRHLCTTRGPLVPKTFSERKPSDEASLRYVSGEVRSGIASAVEGGDEFNADSSASVGADGGVDDVEPSDGGQSASATPLALGSNGVRNAAHGGLSVTRTELSGSAAIAGAASSPWSEGVSVEHRCTCDEDRTATDEAGTGTAHLADGDAVNTREDVRSQRGDPGTTEISAVYGSDTSLNASEHDYESTHRHMSPDRLLSTLYIPAHVGLDIGDNSASTVITFAETGSHFHALPHDRRRNADFAYAGGLYFVTEEGQMYAFRWNEKRRADGVSSYVIPSYDGSARACAPLPQELVESDIVVSNRSRRHCYFSLDVMGHVGPASAIAALDLKLLYIANDGADGSLRHVGIPGDPAGLSSNSRTALGKQKYILHVRQEFLNMGPISDFMLLEHQKLGPAASEGEQPGWPGRKRSSVSSTRHSEAAAVMSPKLKGIERSTNMEVVGLAQERGFKRGRSAATLDFVQPAGSEQGRRETLKPAINMSQAAAGPARGDERQAYWSRGKVSSRGAVNEKISGIEQLGLIAPSQYDEDLCVSETTSRETEVIVCSGLGRHGTVRILRPGAAVSVFSSSAPVFPNCNNMWSLRPTRAARYHFLLVLTFADSTGVFLPAPPHAKNSGTIARLLDASAASSILLDHRTISMGRIKDGWIAQVHRRGVRIIELARTKELSEPFTERNGVVSGAMARSIWDWKPEDDSIVSVACVGLGYIVVSLMKARHKPRIALLRHSEDVGTFMSASSRSRLDLVDIVSVESEMSSLEILEISLTSSSDVSHTSPFVAAATYLPSVELWSLDSRLTRVYSVDIPIWRTELPISPFPGDISGDWNRFSSRPDRFGHRSYRTATARRSADRNAAIRDFGANSSAHGSVVESLCAVELGGHQFVFAGSRDGYVIHFQIVDKKWSNDRVVELALVSRRHLGSKPVRVSVVNVATGRAVLAEGERPWMGLFAEGGMRWLPLNLFETRAGAAFSVPGAERCIAFVGRDHSLHMCGVRRSLPVSVSTIHIGSTPRRVLALDSAPELLVVASSSDGGHFSAAVERLETVPGSVGQEQVDGPQEHGMPAATRLGSQTVGAGRHAPIFVANNPANGITSDLRVYRCSSGRMESRVTLLPAELAHVLVRLSNFVVLGTSFDLRKSCAHRSQVLEKSQALEKGRLLLYAPVSRHVSSLDVSKTSGRDKAHYRHAASDRQKSCPSESTVLSSCCEIVLPGAVLSGAVSSCQEMLVVSSNEHVFVFGLSRARSALVEVARTSMRAIVVSISIGPKFICVADQRDSIAFYRLDAATHRLVRDRGDYRKRSVACAVMVDDCTVIASDKRGALFSLAYDERDIRFLPKDKMPPRMSNLVPANLFAGVQMQESSQELALSSDGALSPSHPATSQDVDMHGNDDLTGVLDTAGSSNIGTQSTAHHESEPAGHPFEGNAEMGQAAGSDAMHAVLATSGLGIHQPEPGTATGASNIELHAVHHAQNDQTLEVAAGNAAVGQSDVTAVGSIQGGGEGADVETSEDVMDTTNESAHHVTHPQESQEGNGEPNIQEISPNDGTIEPDEVGDGYGEQQASDTGDEGGEAGENDGAPADQGDSDDIENEEGLQPVQRNLVSRHLINLNDVALCLRVGTMARFESRPSPLVGKDDRGNEFWTSSDGGVVAGTLSGALVVAVPLARVELVTLLNVMRALTQHLEVVGLCLGTSHHAFRSAFGLPLRDCLDGDVLELYSRLPLEVQLGIAHTAGYPGDENVHKIIDLVQKLCDRAQ